MVTVPLHDRFVESAPHASLNESAFGAGHSEFRMLRAKRRPDFWLALRPARSSDGDALQTYVRGLSPQSRYNRFLGAANELPASELARAMAVNGRDTLTLLLTSTAADRETLVGEGRVALSCAERAGEFGMSIADDWRDQRGDDRTGAPPWLSPWTRLRSTPRASSEAIGRRSS